VSGALVSRLRSLAGRSLVLTFIATGALCGVLAVAFHKLVDLAGELLIGRALAQEGVLRVVLVLATPVTVFVLLAWAVTRFAPRAVGANLARVRMAYNHDPRLLGPRTVTATFIATPLSLGAGAPMGPEGPIVVICSGVASWLGRVLKLPDGVVRGMIPIGVAAGIAGVFNTPMTGVVFALEEVIGTAEREILGGILVGSVSAAVVERMLLGGQPLLAAPFSTWSDPRELLGFALLGVIAGLVSGAAIAAAHRLKVLWAGAMPSMIRRAALAGLLIGALGLAAPQILGVGYESVAHWLRGGGTLPESGLALALKLVAFTIAVSGGIIGGTFAPSLFIGTALGATIGLGANALFPAAHIDPKAYAIVGMGAFFAGLLRSPIAAVLIVFELTRDYELILPLMLAVSLALALSRWMSRLSMVEQQMVDEGYEEPGAVSTS
jgi:chloride channel protein, CIC family